MLSSGTNYDLQGVVKSAKGTVPERLATRSYIHALNESVRVSILQKMNELHAENRLVIKNGQYQRDQLLNRLSAIENQLESIASALSRLADGSKRGSI